MPEVCVITGGAGGIGLAAAKIVGRNHAVVIADISQDALDVASAELVSLGVTCQTVVCDVTDHAHVAELVDRATALGTVTSVIHAAGVSPSMGAAERIIRINALGSLHVNEAFYPVAADGFTLVNVASTAAHIFPSLFIPKRHFKLALRDEDLFMKRMTSACKVVPKSMQPGLAYSMSKNFVVWYCTSQAARFGSRGARLISVSPGTIDTAMGRLEEQAGSGAMVERAALKRFGRPEEVAELLAFCASEKASFITGVDIPCDGGVLATMKLRHLVAVARGL